MNIVATIQTAESVAAAPKSKPGALRIPNIADRPINATAAMMKRDDCIGLVGLNGEVLARC